MRGEPVRGGLPEPGFYSLLGLEQGRALQRGLVPRPPLAHLTGLTVTQIRPGTATVTAPASPWLDSGDGLQIQALAEAALSTAVLTGAPGGTEIRTAAVSCTQFRPATLDADKLIAHARTIGDTTTFTYAEVTVEDDLGRDIARMIGAVIVRARQTLPPAWIPLERPFEEPVYPTPAPYLRPLPPGVRTHSKEDWEQRDGLTRIRMYGSGEPTAPIAALLGLRVLEVDPGRLRLAMGATDWFCLRDREVAPGVLVEFLHIALTAGCVTLGGPGSRVGVVNLSVRLLRPVVPDGRDLIADAKVIDQQGDSVVASAIITDADGQQVATAYETSVLLPARARPAGRIEPVLATVVFTDLVGSTARASQLGDEQWRQLLREHEDGVRHQLQRFAGREIKSTGDGFLATFDSPARAARCAQAIRDTTRRLGMDVRVGLHTGECEFGGGDVTGIAVHFASRVLDAAVPGEILVSSTVRDLLLGSGLRFEGRGRHTLKGIEGEWQLFALEE